MTGSGFISSSECFRSKCNIDVFRKSLDQLSSFAERRSSFENKMRSLRHGKKRFQYKGDPPVFFNGLNRHSLLCTYLDDQFTPGIFLELKKFSHLNRVYRRFEVMFCIHAWGHAGHPHELHQKKSGVDG